ncbi:hypothetical protein RB594_006127 [Gaeumannomyces avenae]
MCGIVASVHLPPVPGRAPNSNGTNGTSTSTPSPSPDTLRSQLQQAAAKLRHRGPDAEGVWLAPGGGVGLGHSRLSIVDLSHGGDQPLHSDDGRVHAVVNGEIYDHDAIRARLARDHGYVFGGTSDSEVALALYKVYGAPAFLERMRGEFAFVIHDERDGRTIAGRDRFGIKPLFWTITGSGGGGRRLLLASECKAFLPLGWESEWDVPSLFDASAMSGDKFVFKGVRKILPGYWMEVDKHGEIKHHEYWDVNYRDKREVETRTMEEMIEGVRERLIEAVRLRLRADVPVGIYISGGIDSSAIAGIVAKLVREEGVKLGTRDPTERISCFSIKFPSASGFDESDIAARTAEWLGVSIEKIDMDEAALARHFADAVYHNEHHHYDLNTVGKFALSTLPRRSGVPVVVTGEGADELFAGYPFLPDSFTDADSAMPHTALAREGELRAQIQRLMASGMTDILAAKGFFADRGDAAAAPRLYLGAYPGPHSGLFAPWIAEEAREGAVAAGKPKAAAAAVVTARKVRDEWHSLHGALYHYIKGPLSNMILACLGDRCEMAHSVEGRPPFLDHKLTEYVAGLPPSVKVSFGPRGQQQQQQQEEKEDGAKLAGWELTEKWILREAARPFLTPELYERRKHPYSAPLAWPRGGPIHEMLEGLLTDEAVAALGFVDGGAVRRALEAGFGDGADARAFRILLIVASWVVIGQRFGVKTARREDWPGLGVSAWARQGL